MNKLLTLASVGALFIVLAMAHPRSANVSIVTVSARRIAAQSNAGKLASQQLDTMKQARGRELAAKQKELEEIVRELAAPSSLAAADHDRLSRDETRRRAELQELTRQAQTDLQKEQARLEGEIREKLTPILADIAQRHGVDVVLNSDTAVVWAAPGTDATDEVLHHLNAAPQ